jgi:hypothetical protein
VGAMRAEMHSRIAPLRSMSHASRDGAFMDRWRQQLEKAAVQIDRGGTDLEFALERADRDLRAWSRTRKNRHSG